MMCHPVSKLHFDQINIESSTKIFYKSLFVTFHVNSNLHHSQESCDKSSRSVLVLVSAILENLGALVRRPWET